MRLIRGLTLFGVALAAVGPVAASAQTTPRIIMRRPLPPSETAPTPPGPVCGQAGQPACPDTNCDYVAATWEVGVWSGAACGENGTVTRSVRCVGVTRTGQRVPRSDDFCLQDEAAFAASCGNPPLGGANL